MATRERDGEGEGAGCQRRCRNAERERMGHEPAPENQSPDRCGGQDGRCGRDAEREQKERSPLARKRKHGRL